MDVMAPFGAPPVNHWGEWRNLQPEHEAFQILGCFMFGIALLALQQSLTSILCHSWVPL
jgi:hypothetical protein